MAQDLETLLTGLREGKGPAIILLHGDEFRVRGASRAILGLIAPDSDHNLGTTTFDGRSASWDEVEAALMTPSPVRLRLQRGGGSVPWFAPAERKVDLLDKSLNLWEEGRRDESGRAFMALLRSEGGRGSSGWTRGMLRNWRAPSRTTGRMPGRSRPSGNTAASRVSFPAIPRPTSRAGSCNSWSEGCRTAAACCCWRPRWTSAGAATSS